MVDPLVMTLRALQSDANNKGAPAPMSWRALNSINGTMGAPDIDYDRFAAQWDAEDENGILHQLVDRFDAHGLVIKTDAQQPKPQQQGTQQSSMSKDAMAATRRGEMA